MCSEKAAEEEIKNSIHGAELEKNSIHGAELEQNSIHGAELKQNSIHVCRAETEQYTLWRAEKQRRQENKMTKDEVLCFLSNKDDKKQDNERIIFCFLYEKEDSTPLKSRLIDYYQDEERSANVDDYPSVHMTLQQSSGEWWWRTRW